MARGHFIVLEGIDGAGTTTQASGLKTALEKRGLPVRITAEPSQGPVGSIIRQILRGTLGIQRSGGISPPDWTTLALMFAADRREHLESVIEPSLAQGINVICDRYTYSSVVYQSVTSGENNAASWITDINRFARAPDLVLYLKIRPEVAIRRCKSRDIGVEIFDDLKLQEQFAAAYDALWKTLPDINTAVIDAEKPVDEAEKECWSNVETLLSEGEAT